jgi:hypothetical protein
VNNPEIKTALLWPGFFETVSFLNPWLQKVISVDHCFESAGCIAVPANFASMKELFTHHRKNNCPLKKAQGKGGNDGSQKNLNAGRRFRRRL